MAMSTTFSALLLAMTALFLTAAIDTLPPTIPVFT